MSAPSYTSLAEIEKIRPECDGRTTCHAPATHVARIHQLDSCNEEWLTADGAAVLLLCMHCLAETANLIKADLATRLPKVGRIQCLTCGRPVACLHDVLETEHL